MQEKEKATKILVPKDQAIFAVKHTRLGFVNIIKLTFLLNLKTFPNTVYGATAEAKVGVTISRDELEPAVRKAGDDES